MIIKQYKLSKTKRVKEAFVIEINGEFGGFISINHIVYGHKATTSSLVAPFFRGRGIGTLAHKVLLPYAFKTYKLVRIVGRCREYNKASARMLEKSGYKFEGRLRKDHKKKGRYYDNLVYAKLK